MAPKHLQGGGHVGHLVPSFDLDLALQFSPGHSPHALRQQRQAAQQYPSHDQPGDEHGADDAEPVDGDEEDSARQNGLCGFLSVGCRSRLRRFHQLVDGRHQVNGDSAVLRQEVSLPRGQSQLADQQIEAALLSGAQLEKKLEVGGDLPKQFGLSQRRQAPFDAIARRLELVSQRLDQEGVRNRESTVQKLRGGIGVRQQIGQVTKAIELIFREMFPTRSRRLPQGSVSRDGVKELVIHGREDDPLQASLQIREFGAQSRTPLGQFVNRRHVGFDGLDVRSQGIGVSANAPETFVGRILALQNGQLLLERRFRLVDACRNLGEVVGRFGGGQPRRSRDQGGAVLRHTERGLQFREPKFIDPPLQIAHAVKGKPAHETRGDRQGDGASDGDVELRRDPKATLQQTTEQAVQSFDHGAASSIELMGRY